MGHLYRSPENLLCFLTRDRTRRDEVSFMRFRYQTVLLKENLLKYNIPLDLELALQFLGRGMSKERREGDDEIRGRISEALTVAIGTQDKDQVAALLGLKRSTLYKCLAGDQIPGAQVLWRACKHLGLVLDAKGLHLAREASRRSARIPERSLQYELPFINESVVGDKLKLHAYRKGNEFVQVQLRIRIAG
jgi:DNA-binding phage protein